ncbi:immunity 49 family protein [Phytomonospora sp. NPDC050363]|uniref:immunity 49 family protein n=1 Tax=Phytomonospora sp. NPDC050363 TaxID=3155642 RepID=UPI0033FC0BEA
MRGRSIDPQHAERTADRLWKSAVEQAAERIERSPGLLRDLAYEAQAVIGYRSVGDPSASRQITREAFVLADEAYSALFAVALAPEGSVVRSPVRGPRTMAGGTIIRGFASVEAWLDALWFSVILRDDESLRRLCTITENRLRETGGLTVDPYVFTWVRALQGYFANSPDALDLLYAAMEATDPETLKVSPEHALLISYPAMKLLYFLALQEPDGFNEALEEAVDLHDHFWSSEPDLLENPYGFTAGGPLALACAAHDLGMPVTVGSPYLPRSIVSGAAFGRTSV